MPLSLRFVVVVAVLSLYTLAARALPDLHTLTKYAVNAAAGVRRCFQEYPPVLTLLQNGSFGLTDGYRDHGETIKSSGDCHVSQTLMQYSFANSYGHPFVGSYTPPKCKFNRVVFNLTVTAKGRQFDRLARAYLGDTEIWRTSTAEPTSNGIVWTYIKDVSEFAVLFRQPQKLIFELGNVVDDTYTAPFNTILQATFFNADDTVEAADQIVAVSPRLASSNQASVWQVPAQKASSSLTLPRNVKRAVFTISATGQATEEFWYTNVFSSEVATFGSDANSLLPGYSPFREVQLYIDGRLAGVAWPFPIIFTGGIVPGLWNPLVGIDAFDLRENEIDISPWLPLLCDGKSHTYEIKVAGLSDDGKNYGQEVEAVGSYWDVTGKIFLFLDADHNSVTTGSMTQVSTPNPTIQLSSTVHKDRQGQNSSLTYATNVQRQLRISSTIKTSSGTQNVAWAQNLTFTNNGNMDTTTQTTIQQTRGVELSTLGYARSFDYPLTVVSYGNENEQTGELTLRANISRGQDLTVLGRPVFPTGLQSFQPVQDAATQPAFQGVRLATTQNGTASYRRAGNNKSSTTSGSTTQQLTLNGVRADTSAVERGGLASTRGSVELYSRRATATNGTVVSDSERIFGQSRAVQPLDVQSLQEGKEWEAPGSMRALLGRGPGTPKGFPLGL